MHAAAAASAPPTAIAPRRPSRPGQAWSAEQVLPAAPRVTRPGSLPSAIASSSVAWTCSGSASLNLPVPVLRTPRGRLAASHASRPDRRLPPGATPRVELLGARERPAVLVAVVDAVPDAGGEAWRRPWHDGAVPGQPRAKAVTATRVVCRVLGAPAGRVWWNCCRSLEMRVS